MKLPLNFKAEAITKNGIQQNWTIHSYGNESLVAIPPEFNGPGGGFSPEDLFAQALTNCLIATFKVYAENSKLSFDELRVQTQLVVDANENRQTIMKKAHFKVMMKGVSNFDKCNLLLKKAFDSGFILNSVKTELSYELIYEDTNSAR